MIRISTLRNSADLRCGNSFAHTTRIHRVIRLILLLIPLISRLLSKQGLLSYQEQKVLSFGEIEDESGIRVRKRALQGYQFYEYVLKNGLHIRREVEEMKNERR